VSDSPKTKSYPKRKVHQDALEQQTCERSVYQQDGSNEPVNLKEIPQLREPAQGAIPDTDIPMKPNTSRERKQSKGQESIERRRAKRRASSPQGNHPERQPTVEDSGKKPRDPFGIKRADGKEGCTCRGDRTMYRGGCRGDCLAARIGRPASQATQQRPASQATSRGPSPPTQGPEHDKSVQ
jgi:hypothetical protein